MSFFCLSFILFIYMAPFIVANSSISLFFSNAVTIILVKVTMTVLNGKLEFISCEKRLYKSGAVL